MQVYRETINLHGETITLYDETVNGTEKHLPFHQLVPRNYQILPSMERPSNCIGKSLPFRQNCMEKPSNCSDKASNPTEKSSNRTGKPLLFRQGVPRNHQIVPKTIKLYRKGKEGGTCGRTLLKVKRWNKRKVKTNA